MSAFVAPARGPAVGMLLVSFGVAMLAAFGCGGSTSSPSGDAGTGGKQDAGVSVDGRTDSGLPGSGGATGTGTGGSATGGSSAGTGGASATGGSSGSGGAGGSAGGCVVDVFKDLVPLAAPLAQVRLHAEVHNPGGRPKGWAWSVKDHAGTELPTSDVGGDTSMALFSAAIADTYEVTVDYAPGSSFPKCFGRMYVTVEVSCPGCFRFRMSPPVVDGLSLPVQDLSVDVNKSADVKLLGGIKISIDPRDLGGSPLPAYVRIMAPDGGLLIEGFTGSGPLNAYWLVGKQYDVLVVPSLADHAPQLFSPAKGVDMFVIDGGLDMTGQALDGNGDGVGNVQVLLRTGIRPSTLRPGDPRGNFSLQTRAGVQSALIVAPPESGLPEVHLSASPGLEVFADQRHLMIEWASVSRGALTTTVTTAAGAPVAGARVRVESAVEVSAVAKLSLYAAQGEPTALQTLTASGAVRIDGMTDAGGVLRFPAVPAGNYRMTIVPPSGSAPGALTTLLFTKTAADQSQTVPLQSLITLNGTLLPGAATAGTRVMARDQGTGFTADDSVAIVDAAGKFSLSLAPNRTYRLLAEPAPKARFARTVLGLPITVDATPMQTLAAPLKLATGQNYTMYAKDAGGSELLRGIAVQVFCVPSSSSTSCLDPNQPLAEAISGPGGEFTVTLPVPDP